MLALATVLAYALVSLWLLGGSLEFPLDDSWIHLLFARSLAEGHGMAVRPGELVTGSTAPLWTGLLSLGFLWPGGAFLWARLLGAALHAAAAWAAAALARELDLSPPLPLLAGALTATTSWLAWSALSAMEVPLFVALSLTGMVLHLRERRAAPGTPPLSLGVLALSTLARPEGILLLALAVADRLLGLIVRGEGGWWRSLAAGLGLAGAALLPVLLFYRLAGGSFLPTTFAAKAPPPGDPLPDVGALKAMLGLLFQAQPLPTLLAGAGVLALLARLGTRRDAGLLPALWLLALPLGYAVLTPAGWPPLVGNFGRYLFPVLPVICVLAMVGCEGVAERLRALPGRTARRWLGALLAVLLFLPTLADAGRGALRLAHHADNVRDSDVAMARWLAPRLPEQAVLAVNDIGALGYLLPNPLVDLAGIATPEVKRWQRRARREGRDWRDGLMAYLETVRPDYAVIFPSWFPGLVGPRGPFRPIHRFEISDNVTMGDDEIVVCTTPWTDVALR